MAATQVAYLPRTGNLAERIRVLESDSEDIQNALKTLVETANQLRQDQRQYVVYERWVRWFFSTVSMIVVAIAAVTFHEWWHNIIPK